MLNIKHNAVHSKLTVADLSAVDEFVLENYEKYKTDETWIVKDGIIDLETYNQSKYKILWILKEVYEVSEGDDNSMFGDWDIRQVLYNLREGNRIKAGWGKTFKKIVLSTHGILHNESWNGMEDIDKKPEMINIIRNVAYINIKKQPGRSVAVPNELEFFYNRDKSVILYQIERFAPDVVIFGGTSRYLAKDLGLKEENAFQLDGPKFYIQDKKIYICAYHPNARVSEIPYVDGIVEAVRHMETVFK